MKPSSQSASHRKPVGGVRSVALLAANNISAAQFDKVTGECTQLVMVDHQAVMNVELVEDRSSLEEEFSFDDGLLSVEHRLTLVADRNMAEAWFDEEFRCEATRCGLCAVVTLSDGRVLLVGYSERFGAEQPLRIKSLHSHSGCRLVDMPTLTLTLESCDSSAAAICQTLNA